MSYTLLQMVNRLRVLLREEEVTALDTTGVLDSALITLLNRAKNRVLNDAYDWDFAHRWDKLVIVNPNFTYTNGFSVTNGSATVTATGIANSVATTLGAVTPQIQVTTDANMPNTWYRVTTVNIVANVLTLTLERNYEGTTLLTNSGVEISCSTVPLQYATGEEFGIKRVLSVVHNETPLDLVMVERPMDFNTFLPNPFQHKSNRPQIAFVGGTTKGVGASGSVSVTATSWLPALTIWPMASAVIPLRLDYIKRFPDLTTDATTWDNVPYEMADLVVDRAYVDALQSNVQNDPERAQIRMAQFAADLARAKTQHRVNPLHRKGIVPYGDRGSRVHPNYRWATRTVPTA